MGTIVAGSAAGATVGGCGPPVGVLRSAAGATVGGCGPPISVLEVTPMGVAVAGAGKGDVGVEPAATDASGCGVRVN